MPPRNATAFQGQRTYQLPDGRQVPSVTTILSVWPKPWLGAWAAKMVAEAVIFGEDGWRELPPDEALRHLKGTPWRTRDRAADFGTALHDALADLVAEREVRVPEGAEAHIAALRSWWDAYRPFVTDSEIQVVNLTEGYAGSLDLIAEVYGRRLLIDLKSGSVVGMDARAQLAAYRFAEAIFDGERIIGEVPIIDACAVLWVPRDHPADWMFLEVPAGPAEYGTFLAVKRIYDYTRATDKTGVGESILPQARMEGTH